MTILGQAIFLTQVYSILSVLLPLYDTSPEQVFYNTAESNTTLQLDPTSSYQYYSVKLKQTSNAPAEIAFMYKIGQSASISNAELDYDDMDFDGYAQRKKEHFLSIENSNETIYITILANTSISFVISLQESDEQTCLNDCKENGSCVNGECYCADGYIGKDCSVQSLILLPGRKIDVANGGTSKFFLYYESNGSSDMQLEISTDGYESLTALLLVPDLVYLPTTDIYEKFEFITQQTPLIVKIDQNTNQVQDDSYIPDRLIIQVQTNGINAQFSAKISTITNDETGKQITLIVIVVCSVGGALILCLVGLCIYKARKRNDIDKSSPLREKQFVITPHLNKQEFDQFVQIIGSEEIKDKQDNCAICLEALSNGKALRTTPCKHIFHSLCIEQWLQRNHFCPFCRYDMDKKNLMKSSSKIVTNQIQIRSRNN